MRLLSVSVSIIPSSGSRHAVIVVYFRTPAKSKLAITAPKQGPAI